MQLVVIAKEPRPGFVKTRLMPTCTPDQAATIAAAALADTLATVTATPAARHVLALDGEAGDWVPSGMQVIPQRDGDLGDRLRGAFEDCFAAGAGPVLIVGMDTPQLTRAHLERAARALGVADGRGPDGDGDGDGEVWDGDGEGDGDGDEGAHDAVLALAEDGGYWLIGLRRLHPEAFRDVAMSVATTGAEQQRQLERCGYRVTIVDADRPRLVDVDTVEDARVVAHAIPRSRFAGAVQAAAL